MKRILKFPRMDPLYWNYIDFVAQYVSAGYLPVRVPVTDLDFPEWNLQLLLPTYEIVCFFVEPIPRDRTEIMHVLHKRLRIVIVGYYVPLSVKFDIWV